MEPGTHIQITSDTAEQAPSWLQCDFLPHPLMITRTVPHIVRWTEPRWIYTHYRQGGVIGAKAFVFQRLRHRYVLGTFEIRTSIRPHLFRHSVHFTLERKKKKKTPPHRKFGYRFRSSLRVPWARRREIPVWDTSPGLSHGQSRIGSLLCPPIPVKRFV